MTKPVKSSWHSTPLNILKQRRPFLVIAAIRLNEFYILTYLGILNLSPLGAHP